MRAARARCAPTTRAQGHPRGRLGRRYGDRPSWVSPHATGLRKGNASNAGGRGCGGSAEPPQRHCAAKGTSVAPAVGARHAAPGPVVMQAASTLAHKRASIISRKALGPPLPRGRRNGRGRRIGLALADSVLGVGPVPIRLRRGRRDSIDLGRPGPGMRVAFTTAPESPAPG